MGLFSGLPFSSGGCRALVRMREGRFVGWLTLGQHCFPSFFLRIVCRMGAGGWGDDPPPPMRVTPGCDYGRSVKNMRPAKELRWKKPVFCAFLSRFGGK